MPVKYFFISFFIAIATLSGAQTSNPEKDKTSFQASAPWNAAYNIRSDVAMVYGYNMPFMTGIAWGNYQDYFSGQCFFIFSFHSYNPYIALPNGCTVFFNDCR